MKGLTVREALWKVSNEQGVKLTLAVTHEPRTFLGAGEIEIQRKGPAGVTTTTEVMQGDLQEYQKLKAEKQIYREEVQDGTLYYAVAVNRDLPFPGGVSAWVTEIQRYKIPAPKTP